MDPSVSRLARRLTIHYALIQGLYYSTYASLFAYLVVFLTGRSLNPEAATYIRLERIHVNEPHVQGRAVLPAKVIGAEYFGLYIKYLLDLEGQTLKCIDKNDGRQYLKSGDQVEVAIDPADLMVY